MFCVYDSHVSCFLASHWRRDYDSDTNKQKSDGGHHGLVAPLMRKARGAVHQSVSGLPPGRPSMPPLYGMSHLNSPPLSCSSHSLSAFAPTLCLLCPQSPLVCSFPCLRSCFPSLAAAENSDLPPASPPPVLLNSPTLPKYSRVHPQCPWHLWNCLCWRVLI